MTTIRKSLFRKASKKDGNHILASADPQAGLTRAMRFAQTETGPSQKIAKEAIEEILVLIEKAVIGIDGVQSALQSARAVLGAADAHRNKNGIPSHQEEFAAHLSAVNEAVATGSNSQKNLIDGTQSQFSVPLSDRGRSNFFVLGIDLTHQGLALPLPEHVFADVIQLQAGIAQFDRAISYVNQTAKTYCANASVLAKHYRSL